MALLFLLFGYAIGQSISIDVMVNPYTPPEDPTKYQDDAEVSIEFVATTVTVEPVNQTRRIIVPLGAVSANNPRLATVRIEASSYYDRELQIRRPMTSGSRILGYEHCISSNTTNQSHQHRCTLPLTILPFLPRDERSNLFGYTSLSRRNGQPSIELADWDQKLVFNGTALELRESGQITYFTQTMFHVTYNYAEALSHLCINFFYDTCGEARAMWTELDSKHEVASSNPNGTAFLAFENERITSDKIQDALDELEVHEREIEYALMREQYALGGSGYAHAYCLLAKFREDMIQSENNRRRWNEDLLTSEASLLRDAGNAALNYYAHVRQEQVSGNVNAEDLEREVTRALNCIIDPTEPGAIPPQEFVIDVRYELLGLAVHHILDYCEVGELDQSEIRRADKNLEVASAYFRHFAQSPPDLRCAQ